MYLEQRNDAYCALCTSEIVDVTQIEGSRDKVTAYLQEGSTTADLSQIVAVQPGQMWRGLHLT